MHCQRLLLCPDRYLEKARPFSSHHRLFVRCPYHGIAQQLPVIEAEDFPVGSIDVPWKENNAALADLPDRHSRDIRFGYAGKYFFHGEIGVGRDECQRYVEALFMRLRRYPVNTVDDASRIFQACQEGMIFTRSLIPFNV